MAIDRAQTLQAAKKFVEKERYDQAIGEYQKLVADDPQDVRSQLTIGDLYLKRAQYSEAAAAYEAVAKLYLLQGSALKARALYAQLRDLVNQHLPQQRDQLRHIEQQLAALAPK